MMTTIKQGIITLLVSFVVFFFIPVISFASENDDDYVQGISYDSLIQSQENKDWYIKTHYSTVKGDSANNRWYSTYNSSLAYNSSSTASFPEYPVNNNFAYRRVALYIGLTETVDGVDYNNYRLAYVDDYGNPHTVTGGNSGNSYLYIPRYSRVISGGSFNGYTQTNVLSWDTNIPIFHEIWSGDMSNSAIYDWLVNGNLRDTVNVIGYGFNESTSGSSSSLGYIKNVNYSHNNNTSSQGMYEIVSWGSTSTTGIDFTEKINGYDRYRVEFALRDQSTIAKNSFYNGFQSNQDILDEWERTKPDPVLPFDINSIVSRLAGGLAGGLAEHVYPYGGTNRAIKQGLITTAPSYNKMISMGDTPASNRRYAFNALHEYTTSSNFAADAPEIHSSLTGVYNTNLPNFLKGGWFESIVSNSNYYNIADYHLSYNIYARIVDTKDNVNGNWLLIDKHGQPIGAEDDRMNGGYTSRPIKLPDFNPGTDWTDAPDDVDVPDDEIEDNDTVKDEPLGTGYDDGSDNSGSGTTNIYNNYTYNYDNRSWIENHYDNETVQDANEGIDWLKLFSGFFSIFLILFGPFLPEWAVALVTVATPIILGLAIFKVIKGIIPFV